MKIAIPGLSYMIDCRLEIGDCGKAVPDEVFKEGIRLTKFKEGKLTFADDSSCDGTREDVHLSDPIYRIGDAVVSPVMFNPTVFIAKPSDYEEANN